MASALAEHPEPAFQHALRQFGARLFEAAPGLVTWVMLLAPAWIPILFKTPGALLVASAVLVFDLYWLIRAVTVVTGVYSTVWRMRRDMISRRRVDPNGIGHWWIAGRRAASARCPPTIATRSGADPLAAPAPATDDVISATQMPVANACRTRRSYGLAMTRIRAPAPSRSTWMPGL